MMPFMAGTYLGGWYSEFLGWRFLFDSTFRSRCWPPASWVRCFTAAGVGGAFRVSTSLVFSCWRRFFRVADDFQHGQRLRLVPLAYPGRRADRGGAGAALLHHLGAWRTTSGDRHAAVCSAQLYDRHDLLGGGVLRHSGILVDFRHPDAAASRLQLVSRRRRLSFDAAFVRAVRRHRA